LDCTNEQKDKRVIKLDGTSSCSKKVKNVIKNQKYNVATFLPLVLFNQFKFFFNLFFLLTALSQFVPALQTGRKYIECLIIFKDI